MRYNLLIFILAVVLLGCNQPADNQVSKQSNIWHAELSIGEELLPFIIVDSGAYWIIQNGSEQIHLTDLSTSADSIFAQLPAHNTAFLLKQIHQDTLRGAWIDHNRKNYEIPLELVRGVEERFTLTSSTTGSLAKKNWHTVFGADSSAWDAVGLFAQQESKITGTFITETGDFRFLDGVLDDTRLKLSTFDGAHAFLFTADYSTGKLTNGKFYSGSHYQTDWHAEVDESFKLTDPDSLTHMLEGEKMIDFMFPDLDSNMVSSMDHKFQNKVCIVEIMGSWCPNCKDAAVYLQTLKEQYGSDVEIISIAYEKSKKFKNAVADIKRFRNDLGTEYTYLIGGCASKKEAGKDLPQLSGILSFPTTIFIDKQGMVRKIYTGFYGPGTGKYYENFVTETDQFVGDLINEPIEQTLALNP